MIAPKDDNARVRLWIALGDQPGVSAWFSVWSLSRASRRHDSETRKVTKSVADACHNQVKGSPA
ncbi:MAG: hypothetical protein ACRESC_03395 [Gammaproteobacteria bacterium]